LSVGYQQPFQPNPQSYAYAPAIDRKDPLLAIILSFLIPGVGQIYVGRVLRGLVILLTLPVMSCFLTFVLYAAVMSSRFNGMVVVSILATIIMIGFYIWQIVDAHRLAEEYNRQGTRHY